MSSERTKILDRAKKLKELADRGIDGEQVNAKDMLEKYMAKHNVLRLCVRFFALSECSNLAQCLKAKTDAKPLLAAAAVI